MSKNGEISGAEFEVMQILWDAQKPLCVQDVCDRMPKKKWKYKTVATLLMRMEEKGAVSVQKEGRVNFYVALLDRKEYRQEQTRRLVQKLYNGSVKDLAASLFESKGMSEADIEEIRARFRL